MTNINLWRCLNYQVDQNTHICWTEHNLLLGGVGDRLRFLLFDSSFSNIHVNNFYSVKTFFPWIQERFNLIFKLCLLISLVAFWVYSSQGLTLLNCLVLLTTYLLPPPSFGRVRIWNIQRKEKIVGGSISEWLSVSSSLYKLIRW